MTIRLAAVAVVLCSGCSASGPEDALSDALRWYYRWMDELPSTVKSVDCSAGVFSTAQFADCGPDDLAIDLDTSRPSRSVATNIARAVLGFAGELGDFRSHRYSGSPENPTIVNISVPASKLAACKTDLEQTRRLSRVAVGSRQRTKLLNSGITLRFPFACEGDPFYFLYFMKGERVEWIWQLNREGDTVWSYERNNAQRRIPNKAVQNLAKPEMWYRAQ